MDIKGATTIIIIIVAGITWMKYTIYRQSLLCEKVSCRAHHTHLPIAMAMASFSSVIRGGWLHPLIGFYTYINAISESNSNTVPYAKAAGFENIASIVPSYTRKWRMSYAFCIGILCVDRHVYVTIYGYGYGYIVYNIVRYGFWYLWIEIVREQFWRFESNHNIEAMHRTEMICVLNKRWIMLIIIFKYIQKIIVLIILKVSTSYIILTGILLSFLLFIFPHTVDQFSIKLTFYEIK